MFEGIPGNREPRALEGSSTTTPGANAGGDERGWVVAWLVATILGAVVAWKTPPFANPDEGAHYLRNLEVSRGHFLNPPGHVGIDLPCSDYETIAHRYAPIANYIEVDPSERERPSCRVSSRNTAAVYAPVTYLASAVGLRIAEARGRLVVTRLRYARVANALASSFLILVALRLTRFYRAPLAMLMLLPMGFWQRAALSADSLTFAAVYLFVGFVLALKERRRLERRDVAILCALAAFVGSTKIVYGLLCLVTVVLDDLPVRGSRTWRRAALLAPTGIALVTALLWAKVADPAMVFLGNGAQPRVQLEHVVRAPLSFLSALARTLGDSGVHYLGQLVGHFSWLDPELATLYGGAFTVVWILVATTSEPLLGVRERSILFTILLVTVVAIALPLYLTYNPVDCREIFGIQGRYFVPVVAVAALALGGTARGTLAMSGRARLALAYWLPLAVDAFLVVTRLV